MLNAGAADVPAYVIASMSANLGVTDLSDTELTTIVGYVNANNFGVSVPCRASLCIHARPDNRRNGPHAMLLFSEHGLRH